MKGKNPLEFVWSHLSNEEEEAQTSEEVDEKPSEEDLRKQNQQMIIVLLVVLFVGLAVFGIVSSYRMGKSQEAQLLKIEQRIDLLDSRVNGSNERLMDVEDALIDLEEKFSSIEASMTVVQEEMLEPDEREAAPVPDESPTGGVSPSSNTNASAPSRSGVSRDISGVEQWRPLVAKYFKPENVDAALSVIAGESGGNPNAKNSTSGASGLFQQMPQYWAQRSAAAGFAGASIFDPEANIAASAVLSNGGDSWSHWCVKP